MSIKIAGKTISSGTIGTGFFEVTKAPDSTPIGLPWIVLKGEREGPVLEIDGAVHGHENVATDAILRLSKSVDPKELRGTLILIPVLNVLAYRAAQRCSPFDNIDMNRVYPGKNDGRTTERLVYAHINEFIMKSDYIVNCHCGGGSHDFLRDYVTVTPNGFGEVSKTALELGIASGIQCIDQRDVGQLWFGGGALHIQAAKRGKSLIAPEINTGNRARDIDTTYQLFLNLMYHLGMLSGQLVMPKFQYITQNEFIKPQRGGLWVPRINLLEKIKKDQVVGRILDPFTGDLIEELRAPYDGILLLYIDRGVITTEDFGAYYMGKIAEVIEH